MWLQRSRVGRTYHGEASSLDNGALVQLIKKFLQIVDC